MPKNRFGSDAEWKPDANCGKCQLRDVCRDPRKSKDYCCTLFEGKDDDPSAKDFLSWMRQLVKSESILSDSYGIDDRDAPLAPNFYRFCTGENFLNAKPTPFPWQLQVGMRIFGDMCPGCSDRDWYHDIPFDCDPADIPKKVRLRKNGVCPECGKTIVDYINAGKEHDVSNFVGIVGQRCITADSLLLTDVGIIRIGDFAPESNKTGWVGGDFHLRSYKSKWKHKTGLRTSLNPALESGAIVTADNFWVSKPEHVNTVTTKNGLQISGTDDHPIMTMDGWKKLSDIVVGDIIPVDIGQNVWGRGYSQNIWRRGLEVDSLDQARMLGFWVSEGAGSKYCFQVTNYDEDVLNLCKREVLRINKYAEIKTRLRDDGKHGNRSVSTSDRKVYTKIDDLVGGLWRKSADKQIPRTILQAPKSVVCAFLQALFEGDGYACVGRGYVGYTSISRTLIRQLQVVLNNIGIASKMRKRWTWATNGSDSQVSKPCWSLTIKGPHLQRFRSEIGFLSDRKKKELDAAVKYAAEGMSMPVWYECYPDRVKKEFLAIVNSVDEEWKNIRCMSDTRYTTTRVAFRYIVEDVRRLEASNVCLSTYRFERLWKKLRACPFWHNISLELKTRLLHFHDAYSNPNRFWVEVKSVVRSKHKVPTYDIRVPEHHRFMANGLLNHNSGKCLVESTMVPTNRGLLPIKDVKVGDKVIVGSKQHEVSKTYITKSKKVSVLTTMMGYSIEGTPDHQVYTPGGWKPMLEAKSVLIRSEPCRVSYLTWKQTKRPLLEVILTSAPEHIALPKLKQCILDEFVSNNRLVLTTKHTREVQQGLLAWGIFCTRINDKLIVDLPWSVRYLKQIGIKNRRVAINIWNSRKLAPKNVGKDHCQRIAGLIRMQDLGSIMMHPGLKHKAQIVYSGSVNGSLTRGDAAEFAKIVKKLPLNDGFLKNMLVVSLTDAANSYTTWDEVKRVKRTIRTTVYDICVPAVSMFVANGIQVHNSTGIGFVDLYLLHRLLKLKNPSEFYGIKANTVLDINFIGITFSNARKFMWEPMMATMSEAPWYCLGFDTPVSIYNEKPKLIGSVIPGDLVSTTKGPDTVVRVFDNGTKDVFRLTLENGKHIDATKDHLVRCLNSTKDGLVWKKIEDIEETDFVVTE